MSGSKQLGGALLIVAAIWFAIQGGGFGLDRLLPDNSETGVPSVEVEPELQQEVAQGFAGAPGEAMVWVGMLRAMADFIAQDGGTSKPLLTSMDDIAQMVDAATRAPVRPISGGDAIGAALGPRLDEIGQAGDTLEGRRSAVVELFLQTAQALEDL